MLVSGYIQSGQLNNQTYSLDDIVGGFYVAIFIRVGKLILFGLVSLPDLGAKHQTILLIE